MNGCYPSYTLGWEDITLSFEVIQMSQLHVVKMEGLGNTQALVRASDSLKAIGYDMIARAVCNPTYGVAADQMIVWQTIPWRGVDVGMSIYNGPDGEEVEMCGNGARCLALLAKDHLLPKGRKTVRISTALAGNKFGRFNDDDTISLNMGKGVYGGETELDLGYRELRGHEVSVGNPHFVVFADDEVPVSGLCHLTKTLGKDVETHPHFPKKTNVEFVIPRDRQTVDVEVWERGAGYTLACGTGACAVALAGYKSGVLDSSVQVNFPIGSLEIKINERNEIRMTGTANYCGEFYMTDLGKTIENVERLREVLE
jgi:diaminopimelate epimerase